MGNVLSGVLLRTPYLMPGSCQCDLKEDDTVANVSIYGVYFLFTQFAIMFPRDKIPVVLTPGNEGV